MNSMPPESEQQPTPPQEREPVQPPAPPAAPPTAFPAAQHPNAPLPPAASNVPPRYAPPVQQPAGGGSPVVPPAPATPAAPAAPVTPAVPGFAQPQSVQQPPAPAIYPPAPPHQQPAAPYGQPGYPQQGVPQQGVPQQPGAPVYGGPSYPVPSYGTPSYGAPGFMPGGYDPNAPLGPGEPYDGAASPEDLSRPLYGATFGQAFTRFFKNYANFSGRASRSEFWWVMLVLGGAQLLLGIFSGVLEEMSYSSMSYRSSSAVEGFLGLVFIVGFLGLIIPFLALNWRRLHDANLAGPYYFFTCIWVVGWIVWIVLTTLPSKPFGRRFISNHSVQPFQTPIQPPIQTPYQ